MASQKFGRYRIEKELGTGSMGVVYKAFDPVLKRPLAIKVISASNAADKEFVARFFREAEATAGLSHPNIVSLYDIGEEDKQPYIAIEYLEGDDLDTLLKDGVALPFDWKLDMGIQLCEGLNHAHENGVIHRDLKPSNIRVTSKREAKIVDFGVAKLASSNMTSTGMLMGTPSYMSPEQVSGLPGLDGRSDIFGLGVILFELITGTKPFPGSDFRTVMMAICSRPHTPLREILPGSPEELVALIDRALAKEPEDRFQSAIELRQALEDFRRRLPEVQKTLQTEISNIAGSIEEIALELERPENLGIFPPSLLRTPPEVDSDQTVIFFKEPQDLENDLGVDLEQHAALTCRLQRLEKLFPERESLRNRATLALEELERGDFEASLENAQKLLQGLPESDRARQIVADCEEGLAARKKHEQSVAGLAQLLAAAEADDGSAPAARAAIDCASRILEAHPDDSEAASARDRASQKLDQILNQVTELETQAHDHFQNSDFSGAHKLIEQALRLNPESQPSSQLLEKVQVHLEAEANRRRANELLQEAINLETLSQTETSLAKAEEAFQLDPENPEVLKLRERLLPQLQDLRSRTIQKAQIDLRLEAARQAVGSGKLGSARAVLDEVLNQDSHHAEALEIQELLNQRQQTRKKVIGWGLPFIGLLITVGLLFWFLPTAGPGPIRSYQVQQGDSLAALATRFGTSAEQIRTWNGLASEQTPIEGQVLALGDLSGDSGVLLLEIVPWARIESVVRIEDGAMMLEAPAITPLRLSLPAGEYSVTASNASLGGENLVFQVRVEAGASSRENRTWLGFDLDRELDSILRREP